ncbi:MAG: tetratricopeptide repeat protein [Bacteroidetes bacterium]|nr:tetratricopeptide repeat protein [Bacteroidota bacterium]
MCTALSNIGYVYMDKGNIGKAIEYYLKCIELNKGKYEENQQANYSYIATAYSRIKDTANAFYYFNEALQIAIKEKDLHEQASNLNNIGTAYFHVNDYLNAEKYYEQALKLYKTTGSKSDYAGTLMNVGAIQIKKKNFKKANVCLTEVLTITRENDFKVTEMLCLASFGELYAQTNRFDKADSCFKESIKMALSFSSKSYIRNILGVAAESYATSENYKKSYESLKEYIKYNDSLTIEENQKLMAQSSAKYSVSQKQASIDLLKKDGEIANAKMESDRKTKVLLLSILGLSVLAMFVIYNRYRLTQKQKKIIEKQKHEVEQQKDIIEHQKELVDEKQKEILDSITYAKRLQRAILPPTHLIDKHIPSNFVLYQPKDIVAGDFYWMHEANGCVLIAAADSTGHGVPGAMVSIVCSNSLDKAVKEFKLTEPGEILDKTTELVLDTFAKSGEEIKDGMDISLLLIDKANRIIKWSGANNQLWYIGSAVSSSAVENRQINEVKANKQPVGKSDHQVPFVTHQFDWQDGLIFYLLTDGYADQFGGQKGKKYKYKQLEEKLVSIAHLTMHEQKNILTKEFESWRGIHEQVDDVTLIAIKLT